MVAQATAIGSMEPREMRYLALVKRRHLTYLQQTTPGKSVEQLLADIMRKYAGHLASARAEYKHDPEAVEQWYFDPRQDAYLLTAIFRQKLRQDASEV